jgi:NitT/TauT family transport system substrate-binding protein
MKRSDALAGISSALLAAGVPQAARAAVDQPLNVAYIQVESACDLYAGLELQLFKKAGLDVDAQPFGTGSAAIAALLGGTIDIAAANTVSMALAYTKGIPIKFVAMQGLYSASAPSDALVVSSTSGISYGRDLNGKTIAINVLNGIAYLGVRAGIDKDGGDSSTIKFVEMPFSVMPEALTARRVDAVLLAQPELQRALDSGGKVLTYPYSAIASTFLIGGLISSTSWLTANVPAARRFHDAMHAADIWSNKNHYQTAEFVQKYAKVDAATVRSSDRSLFPEKSDIATAIAVTQPVIDVSAKYGLLSATFPAAEIFSQEVYK